MHEPSVAEPDHMRNYMDTICIIADKEHRPFYEALDMEAERLFFADLAEAEETIGACGISVIILDSGYTPQAGLSLLTRIKRCCVSVPVIFLTDISSEEVVRGAYKAGAREYFSKPVNHAELLAAIMTLARIKSVNRQVRIPRPSNFSITDGNGLFHLSSDIPEGILKSVHYVNENLSEKIYLDKVAEQAGMSKYHFCRIFKDYIGMTPIQFLTIRRIERAKAMLRKGGFSIASVVFNVGFNDVSEFNRQFKKVTGQTPSAFKKSIKMNPPEFIAI